MNGRRMMEMNQGDLGLMLNVCLALKPLADIVDEWDRQNSYRPERPQEEVIYAYGEQVITFQHCLNAHRVFKELTS